MKNQKGYAALVIIFVIGLVGTLITLTLLESGFIESLSGRNSEKTDQAFFAAESALEESIRKITMDKTFSGTVNVTVGSGLNIATGSAAITGTSSEKTIKVLGTQGQFVRRLEVTSLLSEIVPGFLYAVHAGNEGFELENNAKVTGKSGSPGNVYSNGYIKGKNNNFNAAGCQSSSSFIDGSAVAVSNIDKLAPSDNGVCIGKTASASAFLNCYVKGKLYGPSAPDAACPFDSSGGYISAPAPTPVPLPDMGVASIKSFLRNKGTVFSGDCVANLSGNASDCTKGNSTISNLIVTGNMRINVPSSSPIKVKGPIWVKGNLTIDSSSAVSIDPSVVVSQIFIVDGTITSDSNVVFGSSGNKFLLFLSLFAPSPTPSDLCGTNGNLAAITVHSNTNSVLFYAQNGCAYVTTSASTAYHGAILGKKIHIVNNTTVEYDPALATAVFGLTAGGGWQIKNFREF